jgi:hypothetical protein
VLHYFFCCLLLWRQKGKCKSKIKCTFIIFAYMLLAYGKSLITFDFKWSFFGLEGRTPKINFGGNSKMDIGRGTHITKNVFIDICQRSTHCLLPRM